MNAKTEDISAIEGFGLIMAESVVNYFSAESTKNLIDELKKLGLEMKPSEQKKKGGIFEGKTFVLTGTLPTMKRSEAGKLIEQNGGKKQALPYLKKPTMFLRAKTPEVN